MDEEVCEQNRVQMRGGGKVLKNEKAMTKMKQIVQELHKEDPTNQGLNVIPRFNSNYLRYKQDPMQQGCLKIHTRELFKSFGEHRGFCVRRVLSNYLGVETKGTKVVSNPTE
ncbi:hypothetical protein SESBI_45138, partial [Sesbania bispinosa]